MLGVVKHPKRRNPRSVRLRAFGFTEISGHLQSLSLGSLGGKVCGPCGAYLAHVLFLTQLDCNILSSVGAVGTPRKHILCDAYLSTSRVMEQLRTMIKSLHVGWSLV